MLNKTTAPGLLQMVRERQKNPARVAHAIASFIEKTKDQTPEQRAKNLADAAARGHAAGGKRFCNEVASAMNYAVETDALAQNFAMDFLMDTPLGDADWPMLTQFKRDFTFKTWTQGESGGRPRHQSIARQTHAQSLLTGFTTQQVEYPLRDFQRGDINAYDKVLMELTHTYGRGLDKRARAVLDASAVTSGLRAKVNLDPDIIAANLPDKNSFAYGSAGADTTGESSTLNGKITVLKLKALLDYFVRWSGDAQLDNVPLKIGTLFISTVNLKDIWDFVSLVSAYNATVVIDPKSTLPTDVTSQVYKSGTLSSMFGQDFNIVTVNTIPSGTAYVASNKAIGWYFNKPSWSEVEREEDRRKNVGMAWKSTADVIVVPDPYLYRFVKVAW